MAIFILNKISLLEPKTQNRVGSLMCSPRAVLSENHLYSVYGVDGTFMHGESLIFKDIDNAAAPAFEYLADGNWRELSQQYVEPFYRFIYTLAPRSRHMRESFIQGDERMQAEVIGRLRDMGLPNVDEEIRRFWNLFASPRDRAALQMLLIARFGDAWKRFFNDIPLCVYEIGDIDAEFFNLMHHCVAARGSTLRMLYMSSRYRLSAAWLRHMTQQMLQSFAAHHYQSLFPLSIWER